VEGTFAGNIFDLGAANTAAMFSEGSLDFMSTRAKLQKRPWSVDCYDALAARWAAPQPHQLAVMFVDNSGADIVLGMLPLARELARRGTRVILAANSVPSINDVTYEELKLLLPQVAALDGPFAEAVADGRLRVIASGSDLPVIDLRYISPELAAASAQADLVILEGMGRGIESNLRASFSCEVLCLGMVKHLEVAQALGDTPLFGCVCRYEAPATAAPAP
jgi:type II pantothenate kinase